MTEQWLPIPGFAGYEASTQGRIGSVDRVITTVNGIRRRYRGRILTPWIERGYAYVEIANRSYHVHRLVLLASVGPRPDGMVSRHLNDIKTDNRPENLTYGTHSENRIDAVRNGIDPQAIRTHCPKKHSYSGANLKLRPNGHRRCRECEREWDRSRHRRQRVSATPK